MTEVDLKMVVHEDKDTHTCLRPLQNLSNTLFMFPPFSMDMTLV